METFKASLDIVDVISLYLPLRKEGVNYKACCPFHNEKSPSFVVSPSKQIYHCFGCGAGGDVIKFVMEHKGYSFIEAVNELSDMFSLPSPLLQNHSQKQEKPKLLRQKLQELSSIYTQNLLNNPALLEYLHNRGFDTQDVQKYALGFCAGGEVLKIFTKEEALELGLVRENGSDFFAKRLIITLFNANHKTIGFVGRTHSGFEFKGAPKYINSKESCLYHKSANLYNLSNAKSTILKEKKVLVVEGYFDALAGIKLGIKNIVATGGTAFNKEFLSALARMECEIVFLFDNDSSGVSASLRAMEVCVQNNYFNFSLGCLKNKTKDLGEVLEKAQALELSKKNGLKAFILGKLSLCSSAREKDNFLQNLKDKLSTMENYFLKLELLEAVKKSIGLDLSKTQVKIPPKESSLQAEVFKAILEQEAIAYIASEYFDGAEFGKYEQSFKTFMFQNGTKDKTAQELLLSDEVISLEKNQAKRALLELLEQFYQAQIQKAKNTQDYSHALALSVKIQEIKGVWAIC